MDTFFFCCEDLQLVFVIVKLSFYKKPTLWRAAHDVHFVKAFSENTKGQLQSLSTTTQRAYPLHMRTQVLKHGRLVCLGGYHPQPALYSPADTIKNATVFTGLLDGHVCSCNIINPPSTR